MLFYFPFRLPCFICWFFFRHFRGWGLMFYCVGTSKSMLMAEGQRYPMVFFRPAWAFYSHFENVTLFSQHCLNTFLFLYCRAIRDPICVNCDIVFLLKGTQFKWTNIFTCKKYLKLMQFYGNTHSGQFHILVKTALFLCHLWILLRATIKMF